MNTETLVIQETQKPIHIDLTTVNPTSMGIYMGGLIIGMLILRYCRRKKWISHSSLESYTWVVILWPITLPFIVILLIAEGIQAFIET